MLAINMVQKILELSLVSSYLRMAGQPLLQLAKRGIMRLLKSSWRMEQKFSYQT